MEVMFRLVLVFLGAATFAPSYASEWSIAGAWDYEIVGDRGSSYFGIDNSKILNGPYTLGVAFYHSFDDNNQTDVDDGTFVRSYGGAYLARNVPIKKSYSLSFGGLIGLGVGTYTEKGSDYRGVCDCIFGVLKPKLSVDYILNNGGKISLTSSYLNYIYEVRDSSTTIGIRYTGAW